MSNDQDRYRDQQAAARAANAASARLGGANQGLIRQQGAWYTDSSEVCAFAGILHELECFDTVRKAIYYFETPWKWTSEYERWIELGRPTDLASIDALRPAEAAE